ncbi:MAG: hypothetical protein LH615_04190 [Ferruginibacter sp.]|nr:hypothetical protein [Ferruginibacter sp.]
MINNQLPAEIQEMAKGVSLEKTNEVQEVLNSIFNGVAKMREQLDLIVVADENDAVNMKLSLSIRLAVKNKRLESEKTFDAKRTEVQQKMSSFKSEDALWLKSKQVMQILTKEIEDNAKWKEDTKVRFDAERLELEMQKRINLVKVFLPETTVEDIRNMSNDVFDSFLEGAKAKFEAKIEAERIEEEKKIADAKAESDRVEAQRLENVRLKAEAETTEKKNEADRLERERLAKIEADKLAKAQAVKDTETNRQLKEASDAREKAESELKAKKDAELKAENERIEKETANKIEADKLAKAPIKKQLGIWVESFEIPFIPTQDQTSLLIEQKFEAFKKWAKLEIEKL